MITVFTDGASRGNPGPAAFGYSIKKDGEVLHEHGGKIGVNTNNVAEYTAVLEAFAYLKKNVYKGEPLNIQLIADSQLIVRQLAGVYKIKNLRLKEIFNKIKNLEIDLGNITYKSIPREQNKRADSLANKALDSR